MHDEFAPLTMRIFQKRVDNMRTKVMDVDKDWFHASVLYLSHEDNFGKKPVTMRINSHAEVMKMQEPWMHINATGLSPFLAQPNGK